MPSRTATNRVESKFNVTTDCLHSAAANGNIGLVQYALSHGQPINSVLDGVLPLHAASSGGNDLVVKLLIEQGADVNAARLPRRYSSHSRTLNASSSNSASAPTIGASGSTPLHFAAANGHANVVRLLLLHGAHADRRDKHGVTPEMVARDNGQEEVAEVLREWVLNKDRDLRERERGEVASSREGANVGAAAASAHVSGVTGTDPARGGWGIGTGRDDDDEDTRDRKLSGGRLKVKASIDQALNTFKSAASMHHRDCPPSPAFGTIPLADLDETTFPRTSSGSGARRPSFPDYGPSSSSSYANSYSHTRRPRSAGQGAQSFDEAEAVRERVPSTSQTGARKLGSKYSLRNIFKKANDSTTASSAEPSYTTTPNLSASPSPLPSPNLPLPSVGGTGLLNLGPLESSPLAPKGLRTRTPSEADTAGSHVPNHRTRSSSGSGLPNEDDLSITNGNGSAGSGRPSILRMHHRSSSGNANATSGSGSALMGSRAIRFDESGGSSQTSLVSKARNGVARAVNGLERSLSPGRAVKRSDSVGSLAPEDGNGEKVVDVEGEEEEYGEVIRGAEAKTRPAAIKPESSSNWHRGRGASFASSTCSLSPIFSPADSASHAPGTEFPFSIDCPPPLDENLLTVPPSPYHKDKESHLGGEETDEMRQRGDSVSSTSTDNTDANPQLSWSSSTTGTGSSVATSGATGSTLLAPSSSPGVGGRRTHVPVDIDIRSISSHAQAEALVQAAQQSILEMDISGSGGGKEGGSNGTPSPLFDRDELTGRSPLSARLAAYGETLALERRLKRAEEDRVAKEKEEHDSPTLMLFTRDQESQRSPRMGNRRLLAPGEAPSRPSNSSKSRIRQPRRPSTSDSVSSNKLPSARPRPHHQTSLSASAVEDPSCLSTHNDIAITHTASTPVPSPSSSPRNLPTITTSAGPEPRSGSDINYPHFPPLTRSITPDPPSPNELALREGAPLSRCSTAPVPDYFDDDLLARGTGRSLKVEPAARHLATASKLTRMGFSAQAQPVAGQDSAKPSRFGIKSFFKSSK